MTCLSTQTTEDFLWLPLTARVKQRQQGQVSLLASGWAVVDGEEPVVVDLVGLTRRSGTKLKNKTFIRSHGHAYGGYPPSTCLPHVFRQSPSQGHPFAMVHSKISRWSSAAAAVHTPSSHSHPFSRNHFSASRWHPTAAASHAALPPSFSGMPLSLAHASTCKWPPSANMGTYLGLWQ
ncbi:hypothetical protein QOT17_011068 [Balamuthia mandrillaris]